VVSVIIGILENKNTKHALKIFKIIRVISLIISVISMIVLIGPDRSSGGTEMTSALNNLTGGWSNTIMLSFLFSIPLNFVSMGLMVLLRKLTKSKIQREAEQKQKEFMKLIGKG
jgi:hypothetical protein